MKAGWSPERLDSRETERERKRDKGRLEVGGGTFSH